MRMLLQNPDFILVGEKFPHITQKILTLWGSHEMNIYFQSLLYDVRVCTRKGFPKDVFMALENLQKSHNEKFNQFVNVEK